MNNLRHILEALAASISIVKNAFELKNLLSNKKKLKPMKTYLDLIKTGFNFFSKKQDSKDSIVAKEAEVMGVASSLPLFLMLVFFIVLVRSININIQTGDITINNTHDIEAVESTGPNSRQ